EKLLTTPNPAASRDMQLFARLGIEPEQREVHSEQAQQAEALVQKAADDRYFYDAAG
ncbi:MAG TPA: biotin synthase, partial [Porticoccaceae bacterium]|nr:biotin synthase [Porticoccaceae bacterium]